MIIGVARTSTAEQEAGLHAQQRDLLAAGAERVFAEQISATASHRPELAKAIEFAREGDVLAVTKPCRLARSVSDLLAIVAQLEAKGVGLLVLSMGGQPVDTRTPTGRLTLTMLGAISEFERSLMLERQREGIRVAVAAGRYKGRAPTARAKSEEVRQLHREGVRPVEIARRLGIGRASVYRALSN